MADQRLSLAGPAANHCQNCRFKLANGLFERAANLDFGASR